MTVVERKRLEVCEKLKLAALSLRSVTLAAQSFQNGIDTCLSLVGTKRQVSKTGVQLDSQSHTRRTEPSIDQHA